MRGVQRAAKHDYHEATTTGGGDASAKSPSQVVLSLDSAQCLGSHPGLPVWLQFGTLDCSPSHAGHRL
jgi:hypothetical protein